MRYSNSKYCLGPVREYLSFESSYVRSLWYLISKKWNYWHYTNSSTGSALGVPRQHTGTGEKYMDNCPRRTQKKINQTSICLSIFSLPIISTSRLTSDISRWFKNTSRSSAELQSNLPRDVYARNLMPVASGGHRKSVSQLVHMMTE